MARKLFGISHLMLAKCETPKYGNLGCNFKHVIKFVSFHKLVTNTEMKWTVSEMGRDERNNTMKSEKLKTILKSSDNIWPFLLFSSRISNKEQKKLLHQIQFIIYIFVIIIFRWIFFPFCIYFCVLPWKSNQNSYKMFHVQWFPSNFSILFFFSVCVYVCFFLFLAYSSIRATQLQRIYTVCIHISKLSALFTNTNT